MIDVLLLLIVLAAAFRLSLVDRPWRWAYSVLLGLGLWWSLRFAVQMSKPALDAWLQTVEVRQYVAIAITLDTMMLLTWVLAPRRLVASRLSSLVFTICNFALPPALFYLLTQTVFAAVGTDFRLVGAVVAAATAVVLPLLAAGARWLVGAGRTEGAGQSESLGLQTMLCVVGLLYTQHTALVYQLASVNTDYSLLNTIMEFVSKALFGIANALLIPDIILLAFFFFRSLVLLGGTYRQFMARRQGGHSQLYDKYLAMLRSQSPSEPWTDYVVTQFEAEAQKDINLSRLLTKLGPVLGLIGTLISMSPALVGLSTGDIAGMAYNMQVVFSATVVGLFISAIGLFTQQLKARWYAKDSSQLDYESFKSKNTTN